MPGVLHDKSPTSHQRTNRPSIFAANLAEVGAVGDRAADRVDCLVANNKIEVCSVRTERVITGHANVRACLPPRVAIALWPGSFQRLEQPVRVMDEFRRRPPLSTERL